MITNPFQKSEFRLPKWCRERIGRFCQKTAEGLAAKDPDRAPFPRVIDLWFMALAFGIRLGLGPEEVETKDWYQFVDGSILANEPWRVCYLQLLGLGHGVTREREGKKDAEVALQLLEDPGRILRIAHGYVARGLPALLEKLEEGLPEEALWNLTEEVKGLVESNGSVSSSLA